MTPNPQQPGVARGLSCLCAALCLLACDDTVPTPTRYLLATIVATPDALVADGKASTQVEVTVRWADDGTAASSLPVEVRSSRGKADEITPEQGQTDAQGVWKCSIRSSTEGESILTVFSKETPLCKDDLAQCHPAQARVTFTSKPVPAQCVAKVEGSVVQLTSTAGKSSYPAVAVTSDGQLLVVYDEDDSTTAMPFYGRRRVLAARFDDKGAPVGQPVAISGSSENAYRPRVVAAAEGHAVVYTREEGNGSAVMFARLKSDGTLRGPPTAIASGLYALPSIAHLDKGHGVTFAGRAVAGDKSTTWFVAVDAAGVPGKPVQVAAEPAGDANSTYPQIVTDGKVFAIAWQDRRHGAWDLFFRLVKPDGGFASTELTVREDPKSISVAAQLVWTGTEYGLVFADTRKEYAHFQIYLARIVADGSKVASEHAITSTKDNADTPGVAFRDGRYWISWIEKPWCGDAEPFAVRAGSSVIDNGADLGMAFTGAGPDIGAVEFGLPWGSSTSIATTVHLALFDPVTGKISSAVTVADNKGFSAFPVLQVLKEKMWAVWFDEPKQQRDLFSATVACEVAP